jgi:hypothetical protein
MPLPPPTIPRERLHVRSVVYEGWLREDGLIDIEARLVDTKDHDYALLAGTRRAGEPVHDMWARVTIDRSFVVRELVACTDAMPYPGACDRITDRYPELVGSNLMHGFRKDLFDTLGGVRGCSHLTELIAFLPTAALQTFAGLRGEIEPHEEKPFQLDRCHALEHTSETVRRYYPKWYRAPADVKANANANANAVHKEMS